MITDIKVLSQEQIEKIHDYTLIYLEEHGVVIKHEKSREIFKSHGATVEGEIVKIPKTITEEALRTVPNTFALNARNDRNSIKIGRNCPLVVAPTTGSVFIMDENGKRYAEFEDLINLLKIAHSSDCCDIIAPGMLFPQFDDPEIGMYKQLYETIKLSDKPILGFTQNDRMSKISIDMAKIAVGKEEGYSIIGILNTISPLIWDEAMAGALCTYAESNQPVGIACCSIAGFTSHINLLDTVFLNNVEIISGIVLTQLIRPGLPIIYGNVSGSSDMKVISLSIGSPDTILISTAAAQMAKYYNIPFRSGGALTDGKDVDAQTGVESSTSILFSYMNDVNFMLHSLGVLETYNSMSFEKWILDEESIRRTKYLKEKDLGEFSEKAIENAAQVGAGGNYLYHQDTLENFKEAFFISQVADRYSYGVWKEKEISTKSVCKGLWQTRVQEYMQAAFPASLDRDLKNYLQKAGI